MSSTDRERERAERVLAFFTSHLLPAAASLRARGVRLFPTGPDPEEDSWYVAYPAGTPELVEAEPDHVADALRTLWEAQGFPELAELVEPLMELARTWDATEESADVSPFIYVMF